MNKDEIKIIVPYRFGEKYKNSPQWSKLSNAIEEAPKPKKIKWATKVKMKIKALLQFAKGERQ